MSSSIWDSIFQSLSTSDQVSFVQAFQGDLPNILKLGAGAPQYKQLAKDFNSILDAGVPASGLDQIIAASGLTQDQVIGAFKIIFPEISFAPKGNKPPSLADTVLRAEFKSLGPFTPAIDFINTGQRLTDYLTKNSRPDDDLPPISPLECRIGAAKFFVPPTSIDVQKNFKTGMGQGALRAINTPKFNSGHVQTTVRMQIFFPSNQDIWGFDGDSMTIDFDKDSDLVIDRFLSSLRGLITQFKYAPFLPIKNQYLNQVWGIDAVALESLTVTVVPDFPFCLQADLIMNKFTYDVYLPQIGNFEAAIHWGRFRQYMGRAAYQLASVVDKNFITMQTKQDQQQSTSSTLNPAHPVTPVGPSIPKNIYTFDKQTEWLSGKNFDFFMPAFDPAPIIGPNVINLTDPTDPGVRTAQDNKNWWQSLLGDIGINIANNPLASYDAASAAAGAIDAKTQQNIDNSLRNESSFVFEWIKRFGITTTEMDNAHLQDYINSRIATARAANPSLSQATITGIEQAAQGAWFAVLYKQFLADPTIQAVLDLQARRRGYISVKEWDIPMEKVGLDPDKVIVQNISVNMGNNLARMQLSMQDEPVYQHIGGLDTRMSISMIIMGEDDLIKLRTMYEQIDGYSRLENGHFVLGFLGIKSVIAAICGMKYCIPVSMDTQTIPNYPHCYKVTIEVTDFDVFQQKREYLSSEQQQEMTDALGKRNPFLRLQQLWGAFNAYPDFPLAVRDDNNAIIGHLDPDYYFRAFQAIDDDLINFMDDHNNPDTVTNHQINTHFGKLTDDGKNQILQQTPNGFTYLNGTEATTGIQYNDVHAGVTLKSPNIDTDLPGVPLPFTPGAGYIQPYIDQNKNNPVSQLQEMLKDTSYRAKTGRMVRAFPTYMLWLIDEGGTFMGVKLFDNFYGLQSVIDISSLATEDAVGDTLVIRVSNLYSRLNTQVKDYIEPDLYAYADLLNQQLSTVRNSASGMSNFLVQLDTVKLAPGVRIHLRMGYSANPNALDTVFNGVITGVETGDVVTITAQSDAIELSAVVNNTNKNGDSGKIDGSMMSGLWMSEPRDLMVRLLTMGSSTFREMVAHASLGRIFSENKYGIKHFGSIIYDYMGEREAVKHGSIKSVAGVSLNQFVKASPAGFSGSVVGSINGSIVDLTSALWANFATSRDYEVFKRNIYPGNGIGLAQYLGGDLGDGGPQNGFAPTGVDTSGEIVHPLTGQVIQPDSIDPRVILNQAANAIANDPYDPSAALPTQDGGVLATGTKASSSVWSDDIISPVKQFVGATHSFLSAVGITHRDVHGGNISGFNQISFRAQTYMRSVWDMFLLCSALLPNYIVAIRPWMDRSTVFYGKPHWLYTSSIIPVTLGVSATDPNAPNLAAPDEAEQAILGQVQSAQAARETPNDFYNRLTTISDAVANGTSSLDPNSTTAGIKYNGQDPNGLPLANASGLAGAALPVRTGIMGMEMHLPTSPDLATDVANHRHDPTVPQQYQHPFYMDRLGGPAGGQQTHNNTYAPNSTILGGDDPNAAGHPGSIWQEGNMPPDLEEFYIGLQWPYGFGNTTDAMAAIKVLQTSKVLVYNTETKLACVCAPGDWGPSGDVTSSTSKVGGMSPEAWYHTGGPTNPRAKYIFGFVDNSTPIGPWTGAVAGGNQNNGESLSGRGSFYVPQVGTTTPSGLPNTSGIAPSSTTANQGITGAQVPMGIGGSKLGTVPGWMVPKDGGSTANLYKTLDSLEPDPQLFSYKFGWFLSNVPVNYTDPSTGLVDVVGAGAQQVFQSDDSNGAQKTPFTTGGRSNSDAIDVWMEFRKRFPTKIKQVQQIFEKYFPKEVVSTDQDAYNKFAQLEMLENFAQLVQDDPSVSADVKNQLQSKGKEFQAYKDQDPNYNYFAVVTSFMEFMWQNSFNRGWLVQVADRTTDGPGDAGAFVKDVGQFADSIPVVGGVISGPLEFAGNILSTAYKDPFSVAGFALNTIDQPLLGTENLISSIGGMLGFGGSGGEKFNWDFTDRPMKAWEKFIGYGQAATTDYMINNNAPGSDVQSAIGQGIADFNKDVIDPIKHIVENTAKGIGAVASGIVDIIRGGLSVLTYGLGMAGIMQQQANLLNKFLNDSMYYDTKYGVGSLMYLVDNPFTREYGEPVIEVREPFQRVHFLSSFQNIIHNGIIENLDDVATVVTATSDGKHPVSVYFDKGSPTELQMEKTVETGLFWDRPGLVSSLLHPTQLIRGFIKDAEGSSDKISSKRVGLWHLKESLKDIYGGELIILGQADIRPHDLIYIGDIYEKMYGLVEVEQVIHHFTPEMGYVTSITPNALVTINDPGRWTFANMTKSIFDHFMVRSQLRSTFGVKIGNLGPLSSGASINGLPANIDVNNVINAAQDSLDNSIHYTGGSGQVVKDFTDGFSLGMMSITNPIGGLASAGLKFLEGGMFGFVNKWLVDQHGCYIQYLTRNQEPMDAGLTYNHGVAVGQQPGITILGNSLRIPIPLDQNGHSGTITTNDILSNLGWSTLEEGSLYKDSDLFTNQVNAQILKLSNRQSDGAPFIKPDVQWVTVTQITGPTTFNIAEKNIAPNGVILGGIIVPSSPGVTAAQATGTLAINYLIDNMINRPQQAGFSPSVALRINPTNRTDSKGRVIAWAFYNAPTTIAEAQASGIDIQSQSPAGSEAFRKQYLMTLAGAWPNTQWDGYLPDGRPYTANWDLVIHGYADIDQSLFSTAVPGVGVQGQR